MTHRRSYQAWFADPGAVSTARPRSLEAVMMAAVILLAVIATNVLI